MKKYFFFAAAALLALAACSKVNYVEQPDRLITFNVANYVNSTKAEPDPKTGVKYYPKATFGTYAFILESGKKFDTDAADPLTKYMDNVRVSLSGTEWVPSGTYYWPKQSSLTFASYSPYLDSGAPTFTKAGGWAMSSFTAKEYILKNDDEVDAQYDLMFSDVTLSKNCVSTTNADGTKIFDGTTGEGGTDSGYTGVPTLFQHQLAKIGLVFQTVKDLAAPTVTSHEITITSAKLVNVGKTAAFANGSWGTASATGDYSYITGEKSLGIINSSTTAVTPTDEVAMVLLPQSMVNGPSLELKYTLKTIYGTGDSAKTVTEECEKTVALSLAENVTEWEINQHIVYTVTIYPFANETIKFDPAVVDWSAVVDGTITVQ